MSKINQTKTAPAVEIPAGDNRLEQVDEALYQFASEMMGKVEQSAKINKDSDRKRMVKRFRKMDPKQGSSLFYRKYGRDSGLGKLSEFILHELAWRSIHEMRLTIGSQNATAHRINKLRNRAIALMEI